MQTAWYEAHDITGTVFVAARLCCWRVVNEEGQPLRPAEVATAEYTVYELDPRDPEVRRPLGGHTADRCRWLR